MGKLCKSSDRKRERKKLVLGESIALYGLSAATFLACLLFPAHFIPLHRAVCPECLWSDRILGQGNLLIMTIMMAMVLLFPLSFVWYGRGVKVVDAYLGGANVKEAAFAHHSPARCRT
jgi:hypothetical protein